MYKPKRIMEVSDKELAFGVCVWQMPDGSILRDEEGREFSAQARSFDPAMENKMREAVKALGITEGRPMWLPGFRKITNSEWEDQMERLQEGLIPDVADVYRQIRDGKG